MGNDDSWGEDEGEESQSTNWDREQEAVANRTSMEFENAGHNSPRNGRRLGESTSVMIL